MSAASLVTGLCLGVARRSGNALRGCWRRANDLKCTRRTTAHLGDDVSRTRGNGTNPVRAAHVEHEWKAPDAHAGMNADARIERHGEVAGVVALKTLWHAVILLRRDSIGEQYASHTMNSSHDTPSGSLNATYSLPR